MKALLKLLAALSLLASAASVNAADVVSTTLVSEWPPRPPLESPEPLLLDDNCPGSCAGIASSCMWGCAPDDYTCHASCWADEQFCNCQCSSTPCPY